MNPGGEQQSGLAYLASAENGNPNAMFMVGNALVEGQGCAPDPLAGAAWLRRAADLGHAPSQQQLGTLCERGLGTPLDLEAAKYWYAHAGENGLIDAKYNLARLLDDEGNYGRAFPLWLEIAQTGEATAIFFLARAYQEGLGVAVDGAKAVEWYRRAADAGIAEARFNLGLMHFHGDIIPRDGSVALDYLRPIADQGDAHAAYLIGGILFNGWEVAQDFATGAHYVRQAAEAGIPPAQFQLAQLYEEGKGVERSAEESRFWLARAAENGDPNAAAMLRG